MQISSVTRFQADHEIELGSRRAEGLDEVNCTKIIVWWCWKFEECGEVLFMRISRLVAWAVNPKFRLLNRRLAAKSWSIFQKQLEKIKLYACNCYTDSSCPSREFVLLKKMVRIHRRLKIRRSCYCWLASLSIARFECRLVAQNVSATSQRTSCKHTRQLLAQPHRLGKSENMNRPLSMISDSRDTSFYVLVRNTDQMQMSSAILGCNDRPADQCCR